MGCWACQSERAPYRRRLKTAFGWTGIVSVCRKCAVLADFGHRFIFADRRAR